MERQTVPAADVRTVCTPNLARGRSPLLVCTKETKCTRLTIYNVIPLELALEFVPGGCIQNLLHVHRFENVVNHGARDALETESAILCGHVEHVRVPLRKVKHDVT